MHSCNWRYSIAETGTEPAQKARWGRHPLLGSRGTMPVGCKQASSLHPLHAVLLVYRSHTANPKLVACLDLPHSCLVHGSYQTHSETRCHRPSWGLRPHQPSSRTPQKQQQTACQLHPFRRGWRTCLKSQSLNWGSFRTGAQRGSPDCKSCSCGRHGNSGRRCTSPKHVCSKCPGLRDACVRPNFGAEMKAGL